MSSVKKIKKSMHLLYLCISHYPFAVLYYKRDIRQFFNKEKKYENSGYGRSRFYRQSSG